MLNLFEIKGLYPAEYNHLQFEPEMIKQLEECFVHYLTKEPFDYHRIDQKPKRVSVFFFLVQVFNIMTFEHSLLVLLVALSRKSKDCQSYPELRFAKKVIQSHVSLVVKFSTLKSVMDSQACTY